MDPTSYLAEKRKEKEAGSLPTHLLKLSLHMPGAACTRDDVLRRHMPRAAGICGSVLVGSRMLEPIQPCGLLQPEYLSKKAQ